MISESLDTVKQRIRIFSKIAGTSFPAFLNALVIPSSPTPSRFVEVADSWQVDKLTYKTPAIETIAGREESGYSGPLNFMDVLARGHNKSSEEAWIAAYLLGFSRRAIDGRILAADRDQGRLILDAVRDIVRLNPWIPVTITRDEITGPAGKIVVLPFDAASSMGLRCNVYILDEIVHWKRQKEWIALMTGMRKVSPTLLCVLTNAGLLGSWQHDAFRSAQSSPDWRVFYERGTLASWLSPEGLANDRAMVTESEARRLYDNEWIDPSEEHDYLRRDDVAACVDDSLIYRLRKQHGVSNYVAAVDYGPRRDRTACVVLHHDGNRYVIDRLDVWQGSPDEPVPITRVESWLDDVNKSFNPVAIVIDPYQMESTIQKLSLRGLPVEPWSARGGRGCAVLAQVLRNAVIHRRLSWYPSAGDIAGDSLVDELSSLRVVQKSYGYRFDHEHSKHDDRAVAIAMALSRSLEHMNYGFSSDRRPPRLPTYEHTSGWSPS